MSIVSTTMLNRYNLSGFDWVKPIKRELLLYIHPRIVLVNIKSTTTQPICIGYYYSIELPWIGNNMVNKEPVYIIRPHCYQCLLQCIGYIDRLVVRFRARRYIRHRRKQLVAMHLHFILPKVIHSMIADYLPK